MNMRMTADTAIATAVAWPETLLNDCSDKSPYLERLPFLFSTLRTAVTTFPLTLTQAFEKTATETDLPFVTVENMYRRYASEELRAYCRYMTEAERRKSNLEALVRGRIFQQERTLKPKLKPRKAGPLDPDRLVVLHAIEIPADNIGAHEKAYRQNILRQRHPGFF